MMDDEKSMIDGNTVFADEPVEPIEPDEPIEQPPDDPELPPGEE